MKPGKKILLIEDDVFHSTVIKDRIKEKWPAMVFRDIRTEKEFMQDFDRIARERYDLVIIDQMIPYTTVDDDSEDRNALTLSAFRGGTRCYERLESDSRTHRTKAIFYTILDKDTAPPKAVYIKKTSDPDLKELLAEVEKALS